MRRLVFLLALLAAVIAGVASASAIVGGASTDGNGPDAMQPDGRGSRLPATTTDPDGRAAWAVRVYQSKTGLTCPEAGRVKDGNFGRVNDDNSFTSLDLDAAGSCIDLGQDPLALVINHHPARGKLPARAVIFGVTGPGVASITLDLADGRREVPIAGNAYITVAREAQLEGAQVVATLKDGSTKSYDLSPDSAPLAEGPIPETTG
jgi:hypothetical protein